MKIESSGMSANISVQAAPLGSPAVPPSTYAASAARTQAVPPDTVVLSREAVAAWSQARERSETTQDIKAAALPEWYAQHYPMAYPLEWGLTAMQEDALNARFTNLSHSERELYYAGMQKHFSEMLDANQLSDATDRYERLVRNRDTSHQYRLDFERRLAADKPLLELLTKMGFKFSEQTFIPPRSHP